MFYNMVDTNVSVFCLYGEKWPVSGNVSIKNLAIRYAPDAPLAIDIPGEVSIRSGERVGIVGRTGSGKSTLGTAFMRLVEYETGTITVDSVDLSSVHLRDLYVSSRHLFDFLKN